MLTKSQFVELMAKHLPPAASSLHLLDIGGSLGEEFLSLRPDLEITSASLYLNDWDYLPESFDAVVAYDFLLQPDFLKAILRLMRSGGRFILINPLDKVDEIHVKTLEAAGYLRILVEAAIGPDGVLIRGEKPHKESDTLARIQSVAQADADLLELGNYRGRFLHLLIRQIPNKPIWVLRPDEIIEWQALSVEKSSQTYLLAFSSLPKAVRFMQPAVLQSRVYNINKVAKFKKEIASDWPLSVLLNPTLDSLREFSFSFYKIDPNTAESPDE